LNIFSLYLALVIGDRVTTGHDKEQRVGFVLAHDTQIHGRPIPPGRWQALTSGDHEQIGRIRLHERDRPIDWIEQLDHRAPIVAEILETHPALYVAVDFGLRFPFSEGFGLYGGQWAPDRSCELDGRGLKLGRPLP
jgi:hypothetical protein